MGNDRWRNSPEFPYYDHWLVRRTASSLEKAMARSDARGTLELLETCCIHNFGGVENVRLYTQTYYGTKGSSLADIIEVYVLKHI